MKSHMLVKTVMGDTQGFIKRMDFISSETQRSTVRYNHCVYKCYQQLNLNWYNHAFPIISLLCSSLITKQHRLKPTVTIQINKRNLVHRSGSINTYSLADAIRGLCQKNFNEKNGILKRKITNLFI
jgi:hypothetical protein